MSHTADVLTPRVPAPRGYGREWHQRDELDGPGASQIDGVGSASGIGSTSRLFDAHGAPIERRPAGFRRG